MELDDQKKIISYTYGGDKSRIAALAPLVEQAAGQGDGVALAIIRDNAVKMTGLVGAVARQLDIRAGKVAMLGGLLIGIVQSGANTYISSSMSDTFVYLILIVVLMLRPAGILGKNVGEKV